MPHPVYTFYPLYFHFFAHFSLEKMYFIHQMNFHFSRNKNDIACKKYGLHLMVGFNANSTWGTRLLCVIDILESIWVCQHFEIHARNFVSTQL